MKPRARIGVALMLAGGLFGLGGWSMARAQSRALTPATPTLLSGSDVGFRVEGQKGDAVTGRLMVRVKGQWVEATFATGVQKLHAQ